MVKVGIDDVTIQEGSYVIIYNSDGSVYKRVDLAENAKVFGYLDADDQAYWQSNVNMQGFSRVEIYLGEPLPAGSYNIELDAGALVAPDGRTSVAIPADFWTLTIADYGISGSTIPGGVQPSFSLATSIPSISPLMAKTLTVPSSPARMASSPATTPPSPSPRAAASPSHRRKPPTASCAQYIPFISIK